MTAGTTASIFLPGGQAVSRLGQGTWNMGDDGRHRAREIDTLRLGLDLGMTLIDTAEMYGDGAAEVLVGEAIVDRREEVFLVSKVLPQNASYNGTIQACEKSLKRLGTDRLDLYLLHWRGRVPLSETLRAFEKLVQDGKIRSWGVSNFDLNDMQELLELKGGSEVATNQVLYNLQRRGIEFDLLPWCAAKQVPVMAYSPIEQGRVLKDRRLGSIAEKHRASPAQVALAWVLRQPNVIAIPKAGSTEHVRQNAAAADLQLGPEDLRALDEAFPPPTRSQPLEMI